MDADDLFGLPLDRFVPERTALAKALRSEGRREEAGEVAATRKPSVAAWAVNQLVRTQKRTVDELFEAGDALRAAQDQVLAGQGDRHELRDAAERERQAVEELVHSARGLLTSEGNELSATILERVNETLHAAALDDHARRQVQDGRLAHELRHVGFGVGAGAPTAPPVRRGRSAASRSAPKKTKPDSGSTETREQARAERQRAERERAAAVKSAREAEGVARRAAQRAARALELAQERRDRAARALAAAEEDVDQARNEADAATAAHQAAGAELDQLTRGERGS